MRDYHLIYLKAVDFCKYLIPKTPKEIGGVCLAAITTIFYSTRVGLALGIGYIGLKSWTWMHSEPKPSKTDAVARRRFLKPTPDVLAKEQIVMQNGEVFGLYMHSSTNCDTRKIPRPCRFFDILTSCYKPLGYWGNGNAFTHRGWVFPSETTLKWVFDENDKIAGNCRLKQTDDEIQRNRRSKYFYNECYLKKLLELNFHVFNHYEKRRSSYDCDYAIQNLFRENIFDESGHVKKEGIEFFIRNHWDVKSTHAPLLALVHAAFGDEKICNFTRTFDGKKYFQLINIPDEPGLRDVIALRKQFSHEWKTIQALLRTYAEVDVVRGHLQKLAPNNRYYIGKDNQIVPTDDSCVPIPPCLRMAEFGNPSVKEYLILGEGTAEDPYRVELFQVD